MDQLSDAKSEELDQISVELKESEKSEEEDEIPKSEKLSESSSSSQESALSDLNVSFEENKEEDNFLELDYDRLREKTSVGAEDFLIS